MITFNSVSFYVFVALSALLYSFLTELKARTFFLFIINLSYLLLLFYFRKVHLLLFISYLCLNFLGLKIIQKTKWKKTAGFALLFGSVLFLGLYRYQIIRAITLELAPAAGIFLRPATFLGVSFFSLRLISLIVDSMYPMRQEIDFYNFWNFLTFFPSFIMGPLDRYERFVTDFSTNHNVKRDQAFYYQIFERIIIGAFKKIVIADTLIQFSLGSINVIDLPQLGLFRAVLSHYMFYIVLYVDFSGYCDIAIGVGQLFGVTMPENFNHPYKARNIQDFWQRWHITFMEWLKDYVYFPIIRIILNINSNHVAFATAISFFLTFVFAGIWHGDGKNFIMYGIFHGTGFMIWFCYKYLLKKALGKEGLKRYMSNEYITVTAQFITFNYFIVSLVWFLDMQDSFAKLFGII